MTHCKIDTTEKILCRTMKAMMAAGLQSDFCMNKYYRLSFPNSVKMTFFFIWLKTVYDQIISEVWM